MSLMQSIQQTQNDNKVIQYIDLTKEVNNLPVGVNISTMCATAKIKSSNSDIPIELYIDNIEKYKRLNSNDIIRIKRSDVSDRSFLTHKQKKKRKQSETPKKKQINYFYNQITLVIRINEGLTNDIEKEPKINLKLFKNGSIQMSGCKSLYNINIVLNKLIKRLTETHTIKTDDGNEYQITYLNNPNITISNFKIDMINSNYQVNMKIDRENLYSLLKKKSIKCSYEQCIRACVVVKYTPPNYNVDEKQVSIYIFRKGNIIITGARDRDHIISAYNYINNILITHSDEINMVDENKTDEILFKLYEIVMDKINKGLISL
jgi:TATA-box binding protein (TBP) (component of TFIID and TFIIIB)